MKNPYTTDFSHTNLQALTKAWRKKMSLTNSQYDTIMRSYEEKQRIARHRLDNNKDIIYKDNILEWQKTYENPVEMAEILGVFIDNIDDYKINMWICLDKDILINVTKNNVDELIRYLYERFPY